MTTKDDQKIAKKQAKAEVKTLKKQEQVETVGKPESTASLDPSAAERSAAAAERQVRLQRWRVAFALISTLIALVTLGIFFFRQ